MLDPAPTDFSGPPTSQCCTSCGGPIPAEVAATLCDGCLVTSAFAAQASGTKSFGDYELLDDGSTGGMGVVYRARQISLDRIVALKFIKAGLASTRSDIQRFQIEALAAASLDHPAIVPVYETGEHNGQPYFSMKYIEGRNLAHELSLEPMPPQRAVEILIELARAVHHAHLRGVLHRDLKPTNILIDHVGRPHLTDFGLAKVVHLDQTLSCSGQVVGSPGYLSPEQASGKNRDLTTATDVFSLGAVFYHALTGRPPFVADTLMESLQAVREQEPARPSAICPGLDGDLETICLRCLEKEPGRRYGSAELVADDLGRWLRREPIQARPATILERGSMWVRRRPAFASVLAAAALLALIVLVGLPIAWLRVNAALQEANAARGRESELKDSAIDLLQAAFNNLTNGSSTEETRRGVQRALELLNRSSTNRLGLRGESRLVKIASEL